MESNQTETTPDDAAYALNELSSDRNRLASRVSVPWGLMAAFGALAAAFVGSSVTTRPGNNYQAPSTIWMVLGGFLLVSYLVRKETGVRFRTLGSTANLAIGGIMVACLILFSVSLGFVSFENPWPVVLTSAAAFAITTWLAGIACKAAIDNLRRG